jgi:hypothetical protein
MAEAEQTGKGNHMSNQFDLRCPKCREQDSIDVLAAIWVRLTDDGTDPDLARHGSHEWDDKSPALCASCNHTGSVTDFTKPSSDLTEYIAYLRTTAGPANDIYQAQNPEQTLRIAQELFDRDDESFGFTPGDCPELQEIRIATEDAEEVLIWQTDEYRLQLAAPKLLQALEKQIQITREIIDAWNNTDHLYSAVEDLISELDSKSQWAQEVLRASERCDLTAPIEDLEKALDENLAAIVQAKGGAA